MSTASGSARWWGDHALGPDEFGHWRVGPTEFWIMRSRLEWRCQRRVGADAEATALAWQAPADGERPEAAVGQTDRLGLRATGDTIRLTPVMADRPVVVHPEARLHLPRGEELVLYVSTPLWVRVETVDPVRLFVEFPLLRPSDTWFGPTTAQGELCYATRTAARLNVENVIHRPYRVVTAVRIVNRSEETMTIEKLKLPVVNMSVFAAADGRLWTEAVTLEHTAPGAQTGMEVGRQPPEVAGPTAPVAPTRLRPSRNLLVWAFGGIGLGSDDV